MSRFVGFAILIGLAAAASGQQTLVYDNSTTNTFSWSPWDWPAGGYSFPYEHGDHMNLAGTDRAVSQIDILYTNPLGNSITTDIIVRLYDHDASAGGALLWTTTRVAEFFINNQAKTVSFIAPNVALSGNDCTVTYQFTNIVGSPVGVGLQSFYPPTVGTSEPWFPARVNGNWNHYTYPSAPNNANFAMRIFAVSSCDPCDVNCDGSTNLFDIESFVAQLSPSPPVGCSPCVADVNADGSVNLFDIEPFVECLSP